MKKFFCIIILLITAGSVLFSQNINKLGSITYVRKGKIVLADGQSYSFRNLNVKDTSLNFSDTKGSAYNKNLNDVYKVTKIGTWAGYGAAMGALSGLLGSLMTERDVVTGELPEAEGRGGIYLMVTGGCTVLGGLIGLCFKKEKTIYLNLSATSFYSPVLPENFTRQYPMLTMKFRF